MKSTTSKFMGKGKLVSCLLVIVAAGFAAMPAAAQGTGYLKVKADPGQTGLFIDGKYVGPSSNFGRTRKYEVAPGRHDLKLAEPRYEDFTTSIDVQSGKTTTIEQKMKPRELTKPPYGTLRIKGFDKFAAVYVNDRFVGHADEFNNFAQGLLLNPGNYDVRVEPAAGGSPVSSKITITADKTTFVRKS